MNIGILEDNPAILELMQIALEIDGYNVSIHTHGQSLLETLFPEHDPKPWLPLSLPYDLLIVDLNLPGELSGLDVITRVRRLLAPDRLPIIVMSAGSLSELDQFHTRFPMLPVIRKPFIIRTLLQMVSQIQSKCVERERVP